MPSLPSLPAAVTSSNQTLVKQEPVTDSTNNISVTSHSPPHKKSALESLFEDVLITGVTPAHSRTRQEIAFEEAHRYKNVEPISLQSNPLEWWRDHESEFPTLSLLAKTRLHVPGTSVPSERVFSTAGDIVSAQRAALSGEHVDMLIFLKKNLRIQ